MENVKPSARLCVIKFQSLSCQAVYQAFIIFPFGVLSSPAVLPEKFWAWAVWEPRKIPMRSILVRGVGSIQARRSEMILPRGWGRAVGRVVIFIILRFGAGGN